ncbi:hypothetical protein F383_36467 [Gossypium arboreum]|uniref:Uncharacterized protein n=1 Tax=Gossypium arboreum TaxID=29729 RepID=A0A0B0Q045_GOSAR|nr:hypothetical protein F383_36207 [Gossypium arboreum]KHG30700.1 hypothetical protein F383_36467 [Gossypium arboreum]
MNHAHECIMAEYITIMPLSTSIMVKQKENSMSYSRVENPSLHASLASFTFSMQWL